MLKNYPFSSNKLSLYFSKAEVKVLRTKVAPKANGISSRKLLRFDLVLMLTTAFFVCVCVLIRSKQQNIFSMTVTMPMPFERICITGYFLKVKIYLLTKENVIFGMFMKEETYDLLTHLL